MRDHSVHRIIRDLNHAFGEMRVASYRASYATTKAVTYLSSRILSERDREDFLDGFELGEILFPPERLEEIIRTGYDETYSDKVFVWPRVMADLFDYSLQGAREGVQDLLEAAKS